MTLTHSYAATGTYQVMVEVWNCDMSLPVTASVEVVVYPEDECVPLESIDILGEVTGYTDIEYTFDTEYTPAGASLPISYTWDDGGTAASSSRTFDLTGTYVLTVTAANCPGGQSPPVTDTHTIVIEEEVVCTELTAVSLSYTNTDTIYPGDVVYFLADLSPDDATKPYSYTLDYGDGSAPVSGASSDDPLAFSYTYTTVGTYTVSFSAWNCEMTQPLSDTIQVVVAEEPAEEYTIYLPVLLEND